MTGTDTSCSTLGSGPSAKAKRHKVGGALFSLYCTHAYGIGIAPPTFVDAAPAGDVRRAADEAGVVLRHADGQDVGLELDGLVEAQHGQVVLEGPRVELRVAGDELHAVLPVAVRLLLRGEVVLAQP